MEALACTSVTAVDGTQTQTQQQEAPPPPAIPVLRLRLKKAKPKNDRKVAWHEDTVDNEHMNKKKSKCCCIYHKPVAFGESSSSSDEECEHCFGHPEKRRKNIKKKQEFEGASTMLPAETETLTVEPAQAQENPEPPKVPPLPEETDGARGGGQPKH